MTQNVYDQEPFFHAYSQLPRSRHGLASAPEWPALRVMLGDVSGQTVLDLGCGYGWFVRWARGDGGARAVHGVDISERMLARAQELEAEHASSSSSTTTYAVGDLETVELAPGSYDVVYSSLTLHYVVDLERLLRQIHAALSVNGAFVFSAEHPVFTAPKTATARFLQRDGSEEKYWPLDGYAEEGPRKKNWIGQDVVKVHRTIGTYVQLLIAHGFTVTGLVEWMPTLELVKENPDWQAERERPMFLLISARKT
jgi:SAM-dependent methyltransferase